MLATRYRCSATSTRYKPSGARVSMWKLIQCPEHDTCPIVLKQYGLAPAKMSAAHARALAQQESQFMRSLDRCIVIIDVAGVRLGKTLWRYARALVKAPRWELPHHTHVINCPKWAARTWASLSKLLSKAEIGNVTLHTGGLECAAQALPAAVLEPTKR